VYKVIRDTYTALSLYLSLYLEERLKQKSCNADTSASFDWIKWIPYGFTELVFDESVIKTSLKLGTILCALYYGVFCGWPRRSVFFLLVGRLCVFVFSFGFRFNRTTATLNCICIYTRHVYTHRGHGEGWFVLLFFFLFC